MKRYMLDTNAVSHLLKQHPVLAERIRHVPMASLCISSVTAGELYYGMAKRPDATRLKRTVNELLKRMDVLPWQNSTAEIYGHLRAQTESLGKILGPLDMLIAAHALESSAVLVSNDQAFRLVPGLVTEDWTAA